MSFGSEMRAAGDEKRADRCRTLAGAPAALTRALLPCSCGMARFEAQTADSGGGEASEARFGKVERDAFDESLAFVCAQMHTVLGE